MSFIQFLLNTVYFDIRTTLISLLICLIVYYISKLILKVYNLPPGPLPLPLLGNALLFLNKEHWEQVFIKLGQKYGPIFTIWMGSTPVVVIADSDLGRETYRKNEFSGRPSGVVASCFSNEKRQDIALTDFGETWQSLRKIMHSATMKYSTNEKLIYIVSDCVESTFKLMIEKEGINKAFIPFDYISLIFLNILTNSAFGKNYSLNDPEFIKVNDFFEHLSHRVGPRQGFWEFSSLFRFLDRNLVKKQRKDFEWIIGLTKAKFIDHYKDYSESIESNFMDALISTMNKALKEGKVSATYFTDDNLAMCVLDMFVGAYDTLQYTFRWLLLFLCYYPKIHEKLKQEIETLIGDRIATHEDRNRCHYVMAFIFEILRIKSIAPLGIFHKAMINTNIGDYSIPKGTALFVHQSKILTDEKYWTNAHEFRPERFLENGKLVTNRSNAFIPFSVGRRVCVGEKLAIADIFLVLVRFIQLTSEYTIALGQNEGFEADKNTFFFSIPYEYEIILKSK